MHMLRLWDLAIARPLRALPQIRISEFMQDHFQRTHIMVFLQPNNLNFHAPFLRPDQLHCSLTHVDAILPTALINALRSALESALFALTMGEPLWVQLGRPAWAGSWNFSFTGPLLGIVDTLRTLALNILQSHRQYTHVRPFHISWA